MTRTSSDIIGVSKKAAAYEVSRLGLPDEETLMRMRADFRVFATVLWRWLKLPDLTKLQADIAHYLQHGPRRKIIMAFRGAAKSWLTAAYALWVLWCDPQKKVLVVSASLARSIAFTNFCLALILQVPFLQDLAPRPGQRAASLSFDVGPAQPDQSPSLKAASITGQITGFRGDLIIGDDVEIPSNSATVMMREKIAEGVKEFDAILKPDGEVTFLGTPQVEASLYTTLPTRGYVTRIWPARYPSDKLRVAYGDKLAPMIRKAVEDSPIIVNTSTEPSRFSDEDLKARELSWGRSGFALQYMLDTTLADIGRYPLKLSDLIVLSLDPKRGPDDVVHSNDPDRMLKDIPTMGLSGDYFFSPALRAQSMSPYQDVAGFVDPSGRGADETALSIVGYLHGILCHLYTNGWTDGYSPTTLSAIAQACVRFGVKTLRVEDTFGDGMFVTLLQPVLKKAWEDHNMRTHGRGATSVEGVSPGRQQKELRILSVLEPVTQQHRLAVSLDVINEDYEATKARDDFGIVDFKAGAQEGAADEGRLRYSLFYQMTHLTRNRDCLVHDDRIESLAGACEIFADRMGIDVSHAIAGTAVKGLYAELDRLVNAAVAEFDSMGKRRAVARKPSRSHLPRAVTHLTH